MAFADRRAALARRRDARSKADVCAQKLMMHQNSIQNLGNVGKLERKEMEAAMSDEMAANVVKNADDIAELLKSEVARISYMRKDEWGASLKVMAANMKETCTERVAIWEAARDTFLQQFPEINPINSGSNTPLKNAVSLMDQQIPTNQGHIGISHNTPLQ